MPIITLSDVKTIFQITENTQDDLINYLIPIVQETVFEYTKNYFLNLEIQKAGNTIGFTTSTITNSMLDFIDYHFVAGDYKIFGSKLNDGVYEVKTVEAGILTMSGNVFKPEAAENDIIITKVDYPISIKYDVASYIKTMLAKRDLSVQSENLPGGYSVTFKETKELVPTFFSRYKKPY
ncbi:phage head-tail connector protein [Immundisolibacter sp.]